jgi:hypothetical protein
MGAKTARPEPERLESTPKAAYGARLGNPRGSSVRVTPESWPQSVEKRPESLRPDLPLLAPVTQKRFDLVDFRSLVRIGSSFPWSFLPARPPWWCGGGASGRPQPDPLARRPAPVIAVRCVRAARRLRDRQEPLGRHDPPCTLRRAVTAVTGVIAVSAMIAGIVLPGPVRAARTLAIGAVPPMTVVTGGRICRDLRAGRDRRDPSRLSRSHDGHGPNAGAVIAMSAAGAASPGAPCTPCQP